MNKEEALQEILEREPDFLDTAKNGKSWICPVKDCGNGGTGGAGDGVVLNPKAKNGRGYKCFKCGFHGDIVDLWKHKKRITDNEAAFAGLCEHYGIQVDEAGEGGKLSLLFKKYREKYEGERKAESPNKETEPDYTDFFLQANRDIEKTDYHRGLSLETLNRFKIGYVENWRHPKAHPKAPTSPRLIIPTGKHSYLARDTRSNLTEQEKKYEKSKVGSTGIYNRPALYKATKPVFIVEGELDALSIIDAGGEAVGLGSVSNARALLSILEAKRPEQPLILALDNDEAGKKADKELADGLERLKLPFYRLDVAAPYKDANEALMKDRDAFRAAVAKAENIEEVEREAEREALEMESAFHAVSGFMEDIDKDMKNPPEFAPTGFESLDALLDGGLYPGLYVMGALSSLGKTTFVLQLADNVAASGRDVLIFSLEMARKELIAKSISRLTFTHCMEKDGNTRNAKTTRGILSPVRYNKYRPEELKLIFDAVKSYKAYAGHIYITEAMGDVGVKEIRERVKKQIRITGKPPVIVIDYLQILTPADMKATDKQNTDRAVTELKRISRDYGIPVIAISSFNRENYNAPVNLASFKESGAIEYSSDALIGLQYDGMDYKPGEYDKSKERMDRLWKLKEEAIEAGKNGEAQKIQAKVLKNRNGSKGDAFFRFWPMFNYFEDVPKEEAASEDGGGWSEVESTYPTMKPTKPPKKKRASKKAQEASAAAGGENGDLL